MIRFLLTKEVAELLRVGEEHVRELIRQRKLKAFKEGRRGGYRIRVDDFNEYIEEKIKEEMVAR